MAVEERITYCRICEALCGMVATVEDGTVTKLRPDPDHPLSRGYACPKGIAMAQVQNDADRVVHPLRRREDGSGFDRVSWDDVLDEIADRTRRVIAAHGAGSVGWYMGNPGAFSYSHALWAKGFVDGLGTPHYYTASSQDVANRFAASALLYGSPLVIPIPDLKRAEMLVMVGANPLVSHGSVLTAPRIREQLNAIVDRGGRVVVIDPRRTETARTYEHLPVRPDSDAWLLLSLLHVVFDEGREDGRAIARQSSGADELLRAARGFPPEATAERTGVPADTVRALARELCARRGAVYGRTGSCLGRFGTLVAFLLDALNLVTGNLDVPGGAVFGTPPLALEDLAARFGLAGYAERRSRIGGFPDVIGALPATMIPREITTPGDGQLRALFVSAGNPALSVPDGEAMEDALEQLDLLVSLDLYVNETNKHAHFILPATTWLEREDLPLPFLSLMATPFIQYTEPAVEPAGEAREEWAVIDELSRRLGVAPYSMRPLRLLARAGVRPTPKRLLELLLRTGPRGDLFGLRPGGLSLGKLRARPSGLVLEDSIRTGVLRDKVTHRGGKVALGVPAIRAELERLGSVNGGDPELPLRLIGMRELRSHNSWMHNSAKLMAGRRECVLRVHPDDARAYDLADGDSARLSSKSGALDVPVRVTDEVMPGTVALPHGWGHNGGWRRANAAGGANTNLLASAAAEDLEPLAGMAFLNGIPVRLERVEVRAGAPDALAATA